jgi:hypothetical protein
MKKLSVLLFATLCITPFTFADESEELARELLKASGSAEMGEQVMSQVINAMRPSAPNVPDEFWEEFMANYDAQQFVDMLVPIYVKHLSDKEMKSIIDFYESPAGQALVEKQPLIMQESMAVGQQWGMELSQKVVQKIQARRSQQSEGN